MALKNLYHRVVILSKDTKRKLTKLATLVEKMPRGIFDLTHWSATKNGCNTTYCAIGYGVQKKIFDGLIMRGSSNPWGAELRHRNGSYHINAVVDELDIPYSDAEQLFTNDGYSGKIDRRAVVRRIRQYAKNPNDPRLGNKHYPLVKRRIDMM